MLYGSKLQTQENRDIRVAKLPRRFYTNKRVIRSMGEGMGVELLILGYLPVEGMKHILHPRLGIALNSTRYLGKSTPQI